MEMLDVGVEKLRKSVTSCKDSLSDQLLRIGVRNDDAKRIRRSYSFGGRPIYVCNGLVFRDGNFVCIRRHFDKFLCCSNFLNFDWSWLDNFVLPQLKNGASIHFGGIAYDKICVGDNPGLDVSSQLFTIQTKKMGILTSCGLLNCFDSGTTQAFKDDIAKGFEGFNTTSRIKWWRNRWRPIITCNHRNLSKGQTSSAYCC